MFCGGGGHEWEMGDVVYGVKQDTYENMICRRTSNRSLISVENNKHDPIADVANSKHHQRRDKI